MDRQKRAGVAYMVLAIASLSFMDALGKRVAAHYSVFQMLAIRSTVALALILVVLGATGQAVTRCVRGSLAATRSARCAGWWPSSPSTRHCGTCPWPTPWPSRSPARSSSPPWAGSP